MKRSVVATVLALGAVLAPTAVGQAQDSVTGSGSGGVGFDSFVFRIDAHSGPSGEAPGGTASFSQLVFGPFEGPVTCLAVDGNAATLNFVVTNPSNPAETHVFTFGVTDLPTGDTFASRTDTRAPTDCTPLSAEAPVDFGDVVVVDAPSLPTSKLLCKHGGWLSLGFKSRRQCVTAARQRARQECTFERAVRGRAAFRAKYGTGWRKRHAMRRCIRQQVRS